MLKISYYYKLENQDWNSINILYFVIFGYKI